MSGGLIPYLQFEHERYPSGEQMWAVDLTWFRTGFRLQVTR